MSRLRAIRRPARESMIRWVDTHREALNIWNSCLPPRWVRGVITPRDQCILIMQKRWWGYLFFLHYFLHFLSGHVILHISCEGHFGGCPDRFCISTVILGKSPRSVNLFFQTSFLVRSVHFFFRRVFWSGPSGKWFLPIFSNFVPKCKLFLSNEVFGQKCKNCPSNL